VSTPFASIVQKRFPIACRHTTFGLLISTDPLYNRVYVSDVLRATSAAKAFSTLRAARNKLKGAFVVSVNSTRTFTVQDVLQVFFSLLSSNSP
jgi:hypothetical protein